MPDKIRVDLFLVQKGFFDSREKARAAIMAGIVFHGHERLEKPGMRISDELDVTVKGRVLPYVSRGGLKLEKALDMFGIDLQGTVIADIGASTGGFTDCALQRGASMVYAIDVGTNQLSWKLRSDSRVIVMEKTNFRYIRPEHLSGPAPDTATIDVSFISLKLIIPALLPLMSKGGRIITLIKPQFEAGRENVGKSGVVGDENTHKMVLGDILDFASEAGLRLQGLTFSPVTGAMGNIEFLACWLFTPATSDDSISDMAGLATENLIDRTVREAHDYLA